MASVLTCRPVGVPILAVMFYACLFQRKRYCCLFALVMLFLDACTQLDLFFFFLVSGRGNLVQWCIQSCLLCFCQPNTFSQ